MNPHPEYRTLRIGLLVAFALVVGALFIVGITSRQKFFERKVEYFSTFPDAAGLKEGGGVWFQGVEVGFVSSITFSKDPDMPNVIVKYRISPDLVPRIRTGTRASLRSLGLLGDKYLAIMTPVGSIDQPNLLPGYEIPVDKSLNLEALGRGAQDVLTSTDELAKNLNRLVSAFNSNEGLIPRLLHDPEVGKATIEQLQHITENLTAITSTIGKGQGFAGKLLVDKPFGEKAAADMADAVRRTDEILKDIQGGRGGAGALIASGGGGEKLVRDLAHTADVLAKVADGIQKQNSLAHKLLMDEAYGEHVAANLLGISDSLASILKKIDSGQGTLGAMVNDRSVYDSLAAVAEGIKKSALVNWYLKSKAEKAAKAAKDAEGAPKTP